MRPRPPAPRARGCERGFVAEMQAVKSCRWQRPGAGRRRPRFAGRGSGASSGPFLAGPGGPVRYSALARRIAADGRAHLAILPLPPQPSPRSPCFCAQPTPRPPAPVAATEYAAFAGAPPLGLVWSLPFAGLLLSIAIWPLVAPKFLAPALRQDRRRLGRAGAHPRSSSLSGSPILRSAVSGAALSRVPPPSSSSCSRSSPYRGGCGSIPERGAPRRATRPRLRSERSWASVIGTTGASMLLIRPYSAGQSVAALAQASRHLFYLPSLQYRRLAHPARRSAALFRIPPRRGLLLDDAPHAPADDGGGSPPCSRPFTLWIISTSAAKALRPNRPPGPRACVWTERSISGYLPWC